jgi:hypothetical protein
MQRIFIKKLFLFKVGSVCRLKLFTAGSRNSLKDDQSCRCAIRSPCWDCDRSNCAADGRVDSSWQKDNDRQCSNCTKGFPWFSIRHNAWSFEVSEKVCARWVTKELKKREKINRMAVSLQHLLPYADEWEDMLNRLLLGTNHGCITTNPNQSVLQCNGNILSSPSDKKLEVTPSAGKVMLTLFGDSQGVQLKLREAIRRNRPGNWQPRREFDNYSGNFLNISLQPEICP